MKPLLPPLRRLLLHLVLVFVLYTVCRGLFLAVNAAHFPGLSPARLLLLAVYGLRYDASAIFILNSLYALLLLLPVPVWRWPRWERFTFGLFLGVNALALLFEVGDWAYFPYNFQRSTAAIFEFMSRRGDFWALLPRWLLDYWYLPLVYGLLLAGFVKAAKWVRRRTPLAAAPALVSAWVVPFWKAVLLIGYVGIALLAIRGGIQYVPIGVRNGAQTAGAVQAPIILNTPFSILTTLGAEKLAETPYFSDAELARWVQPVQHYGDRPARRMNVVLILLESFSKEFTAGGGGTSYTPFFDSLAAHGFLCRDAFANALHSAEGVPAILAGLPALMDEAIHTSPYGANRLPGIAASLKQWGYNTAFYHGGTNGTMSFDALAPATGFDRYHGRTEYGNERDYDGNWGIPDGPFLRYFKQGLDQTPQPFCAAVFTLTAHPPYRLPADVEARYPEGPLPVHRCIRYTDDVLRQFFTAASQTAWYRNTLFVLTADHASPLNGGGYWVSPAGRYAIPILFFAPGDAGLRGGTDSLTQQIDILPSVLDYLGYRQPFFSLGHSVFRPAATPRAAVNQLNGSYTVIGSRNVLTAQDTAVNGFFSRRDDSLCEHNLLPAARKAADSVLVPLFKATLQAYREALLHNRMAPAAH